MNTHTRNRIAQTVGALFAAALLPLSVSAQQSTPGGSATDSSAATNPEQELAQLQQEFISVKSELESVQQQALEREAVKEAVEDAEEALKSAMIEEAPQQSEPIEEYFEIRSQLAELGADAQQADTEQLVNEFTQLSNELNPILERAAQDEEVQQARQESREIILTAMQEINPDTPELLQRQQQLMSRYQQIRQRAQGQGQGG